MSPAVISTTSTNEWRTRAPVKASSYQSVLLVIPMKSTREPITKIIVQIKLNECVLGLFATDT